MALIHFNTGMLNDLEPYGVISMRYSLDLDLVAIEKSQVKYYALLNILRAEQTIQSLTSKLKAIKKIGCIIEVFESLEPRNWPYSFSRIKKIMECVSKDLNNA